METSHEECMICMEPTLLTQFNTLPCNHKLCNQCFPKIKIPRCPFCRAPYGNIEEEEEGEYDETILFVDLDIEYSLVRFLTPRQRRRQRERRRRISMQRRPVPLRRINHTTPLNIINVTDITIEEAPEPVQRKKKYDKKRNKNEKKRIITSNNYNYLRNQQNIY